MARPRDNEYRAAILGALDKKFTSTIGDVNEHLKEVMQFKSYSSTRRMLLKMVTENLVTIHPQRLDKNEMVFIKGLVSPHLILTDSNGEKVELSQFIGNVFNAELPPVIDKKAAIALKSWMFNYLLSADPELFKGVRETPNRKELKAKLEGTLEMLGSVHAFIRHFLDSDLHSPVAEQKLMRELQRLPSTQLNNLVTEKWIKEHG